jgi:hypothetical protein
MVPVICSSDMQGGRIALFTGARKKGKKKKKQT